MRVLPVSSSLSGAVAGSLKFLLALVAMVAAAWIAVPASMPSDLMPAITFSATREWYLAKYIEEYKTKPVVLLGSSITTTIPQADCQPDNVASLGLNSLGAQTGLAALHKLGARPKIVFVEVSTAAIGIDWPLMARVFPWGYWRVRTLIEPLRLTRNWLLLLSQHEEFKRVPRAHVITFPAETVAEWNAEHAAHFAPILAGKGSPNDVYLDGSIDQLRRFLTELQRGGARIIFYDPIDPRARLAHPYREAREGLLAAFPDIPVVDAPDDNMPMYRVDGLHLQAASGLRFFEYLMKQAGVDYTPKCRVAG